MKLRLPKYILVALGVGLACSTQAATITKEISGTELTDGASWVGGSLPGANDVATWGTPSTASLGGTLTMATAQSWIGIDIQNATAAITISGAGQLTLGSSGINIAAAGQDLTLANSLVVGAAQTWNVGAGRTLEVSGAVSGAGSISMAGSGTTTLGGTNSYTGATNIGASTLKIAGSTNTGAGSVSLNNGSSILQVLNGGSFTTTGELSSTSASAKIQVDSGGSLSVGSITHNYNPSVVVDGTLSSAGTWTFSTNSTSTISGTGTMSTANFSAKNYSTINYSASGTLTVSGNFLLGDASGQNGNFNQSSGTVNLTTASAGGIRIAHWGSETSTYTLSGGTLNALNSYFGVGWDGAGIFKVNGSGVANLKELKIGANSNGSNIFYLGDAFSGSSGGRVNIGSGGISKLSNSVINLGNGTIGAYANWSSSANMVLTSSTTFNTLDSVTATDARTISLSGALSGSGQLVKSGLGTLNLSNAGSSFAGNIVINQGSLVASGVSSNTNTATGLASGSRTIEINNGGSFQLSGNNVFGGQAQILGQIPKVVINNGGVMSINAYNVVGNIDLNGGTLTSTAGSNGSYQTYEFNGSTIRVGGTSGSLISTSATSNNAMHIAGNTSLTFDVGVTGAATDLLVSAALTNGSNDRTGNGSVVKNGAGTLLLSANNSYSGGTTVNAGTLKAGSANAFGATSSVVTVNGGTLDLNGQGIGNKIVLSGGSLINASAYTGTLAGTSGSFDAGTSSAKSYTVDVAGLTLTNLSGQGTFNGGLVTVTGNLNPGNSPGIQTFSAGLTTSAGSTTTFEIAGLGAAGAVNGFDQIALTGGTLTLNGTLAVTSYGGFSFATLVAGNSFQLVSLTGGATFDTANSSYNFDFTNATLANGLAWDTSSFATNGTISVTEQAIPEPSSLGLLGVGMAGMLLRRRRKQA